MKYLEKIDWTNIWPSLATFSAGMVPFSVRQGYVRVNIKIGTIDQNLAENSGVVPAKYANLELMKIPNFLHLTKLHIKKHCDSLKSNFIKFDCRILY